MSGSTHLNTVTQRNSRRNRLRHWCLGFLALATFLFGSEMFHLLRLSVTEYRLDRQVDALEAEEARLRQERDRLQSDEVYVEGLIRSTFKVARPGEYVISSEPEPR